ncbi:MAG: hypothetical protein HY657_00410 [Acidobacteria bacterium]|nr:hypothetical protein [Acidobacteriota bacterium]
MTLVQRSNERFGLVLYAHGYDILNRVSYLNFSGNVQSPFFGQPTSAAPARRLEVGVQFAF